MAQLRQEITGLTDQAAAKAREIALITAELKGVRELYAKNLIPYFCLTALERDAARLEGERGQLVAATASTKGKITETQLQVLQIDGDMRTEVGKDFVRHPGQVVGNWSRSESRPRISSSESTCVPRRMGSCTNSPYTRWGDSWCRPNPQC